ncbi:MAG TPA: hypothetical protein VFS95_11545, partial [Telluria sp.]|nr:hypothetical protein [Telluria sp.]
EAMCFLKSGAPRMSDNACCTSGVKSFTAIEMRPTAPPPTGGIIVTLPPAPAKIINPPSALKLNVEAAQTDLAWQFAGPGCFPGAAGKPAPDGKYVSDIEGFKVFNGPNQLFKQVANPGARTLSLGQNPSGCFSVSAYKGALESARSEQVCVPPPPPAPTNLHLTKDVNECAAAAGGKLLAFICDAAIKANGQVLVFDWQGGADEIDGYRLYDTVNGQPMIKDTKFHSAQRAFIIPAMGGVKLDDYCFKVRAFDGERESAPSNTVCVDPLKPIPPYVPTKNVQVFVPSGGALVTGVEMHTNFNNGCPFPERSVKTRTRANFTGSLGANYIHRDKNILCGKRIVIWNEGSAEFTLADMPAKFYKATLKFTSNGTLAIVNSEGGLLGDKGNKVYNSVNCVREVFAYNFGMLDNSTGGPYEKIGDPKAWFAFHNIATIASAANTAPNGANSFDVTEVLRKSLKGNQKKLGFNFAVDRSMVGDNNMCAAGFTNFTLEVEFMQ